MEDLLSFVLNSFVSVQPDRASFGSIQRSLNSTNLDEAQWFDVKDPCALCPDQNLSFTDGHMPIIFTFGNSPKIANLRFILLVDRFL
jgi:hypothetical protein